MKVVVSNIQRMCFNDGPGIRTVVFFKGCNLRCPWCANPENVSSKIENYKYDDENIVYGKNLTLDEIYDEIIKDKIYYEKSGGVTLSGGEPLLKFNDIEPLLKKIKENNINICVETALMVEKKLVDISLKYIDNYIIDIKILDKNKAKEIINGNIDMFYKNLETVFNSKKEVIFRIPLEKYNIANKKNIIKIKEILEKYKPIKVEIFPLHNLASNKYKTMDKKIPKYETVSYDEMLNIKKELEKSNVEVNILNLN